MRVLLIITFVFPGLFSAKAQETKAEKIHVEDPSTYVSYEEYQQKATEKEEVYPDFESMERDMEEDAIYAGREEYPPYDADESIHPEEERRKKERRRQVAGEVIVTVAEVGLAIICSGWW